MLGANACHFGVCCDPQKSVDVLRRWVINTPRHAPDVVSSGDASTIDGVFSRYAKSTDCPLYAFMEVVSASDWRALARACDGREVALNAPSKWRWWLRP